MSTAQPTAAALVDRLSRSDAALDAEQKLAVDNATSVYWRTALAIARGDAAPASEAAIATALATLGKSPADLTRDAEKLRAFCRHTKNGDADAATRRFRETCDRYAEAHTRAAALEAEAAELRRVTDGDRWRAREAIDAARSACWYADRERGWLAAAGCPAALLDEIAGGSP